MNTCLAYHNVSFSYGERAVLRRISFSMDKGEILGILGPNGAGKTTILKCLLKTVSIKEGTINLFNKALTHYSQMEASRLISYVPQEINIPFSFSVSEVIMMGRYPHKSPISIEGDAERCLVEKTLLQIEGQSLAHRPFNELSGGEKQRILLARAMVQDTPLMLLDEPTSNLDIKNITMLLKILQERRNNTGQSILFVTHDLNFCASLADKAVLLKDGDILATGKPKDVLTPDNLRRLYETDVRIIEDAATGERFFTYQSKGG